MTEEPFDFLQFVSIMKDLSPDEQRARVHQELDRARSMQVRDSRAQFQQQIYVRRLERLLCFFKGENVASELTPSEKRAYALLADSGVPARAVAPPA